MANSLLSKRSAGLLENPATRWQAMADSARPGAVGAPGGLLAPVAERPANPLTGLLGAASFAPGIGDAMGLLSDAAMYATEPSSRTWGNALLSVAGALPLVPSAAGAKIGSALLKGSQKMSGHQDAAHQIAEALMKAKSESPYADYALRVLPDSGANVGDLLEPSWRWIDGERTDDMLDGTSAITIRGDDLENVMKALKSLGVLGDAPHLTPNGIYSGPQVALLRGESLGAGEDLDEILLDAAEVLDLWDRSPDGWGEILGK